MEPKVSVIIPVYKVEPYLRQCLDSVVDQTYRNLEIIIIDDGSPDNCGAICDEYAAKDDRITVIHKENGGLCAARNDGIERATGEWIAFVDSDDWCELDYYEQLISKLKDKTPDILFAGGSYWEYESHTVIRYTFKREMLYSGREEMDKLMVKLLAPAYKGLKDTESVGCWGSPWDKIYKTTFLKQHHLCFDTSCKAGEDVWFNFQVFDKAEELWTCTCIGYHYRMVYTSITKGFNPKKPEINYDCIAKLYAYMEQREPNAAIQLAIKTRSIALFSSALSVYYFHPANTKPYKEIAAEIKDMKTWPYYHEAIYSNDNQYIATKKLVLKYLLRLPWVWPLKIVYMLNEKTKTK